MSDPDRVFCGVYPTGLVFADREVMRDGDYKRLAFMPFSTLEIEFRDDCPGELRDGIARSASFVQARAGEEFQVTTSGQTVTLGYGRPSAPGM